METELIDAHIGIRSDGTACIKPYHGIVCSLCRQSVSFKIEKAQLEVLEGMIATSRTLYVVTSRDDPSFLFCTMDEEEAKKAKEGKLLLEEVMGGRPSVIITETILK